MPTASTALPLHDHSPQRDAFLEEVVAGLGGAQKSIPCKYFYDEQGSQLFDQICNLEEYYPTRTEMGIMEESIAEMSACIGPGTLLVEYGSGSSLKTHILLDHLDGLAGYVPIDISREHLMRSAARLAAAYPDLDVRPVCADYTGPFDLPARATPPKRVVVYFPGSTIGNFDPGPARAFLARIAGVCGPGGGLLIGVDLKKDPRILEAAYNDRKGVTAAFNLNVLRRINRELRGNFRLDQFAHRAHYDEARGRIEMHLVSLAAQQVRLGGRTIPFEAGETIHTECSYKYSLDDFARLADAAGFAVERVWTDPQQLFSVQYLVNRAAPADKGW